MRKYPFWTAPLLFLCGSCFAQAPSTETRAPETIANSSVKLADATPVVLRTKQELSSATVKVGDRVPFRVVEDIKIEDLMVIRRGAEAWGVVTEVQPKRRKGHAGSFSVAIQSVQLLNGEAAALRADQQSTGASRKGDIALNMARLGVATAGVALPLLPFMLLEKGTDAYLPAGTKVTAYLNGDFTIERATLEPVQPTVEHRKGPAAVIVFRLHQRWTGYHPSVYCGKIALARLPDLRYLKTELPPGKYFFRSNDDQIVELNLEEGQDIYLELQMVIHGLTGKGHLVQVSSSDGEDEIAFLRQLDEKDVAKISDANLAELQADPVAKPR